MFLDKFLKEAAETVAENAAEAANTVASMAADASEKAAEAISTGTEIVSNLGEQAINAASAGINTVVEEGGKVLGAAVNAAQQLHHDQLLAHYNPVFPEQYQSSDYDLPNLIIIEDEDQRKGVEVCNGAIGWLQVENGMEILHLYDEAVEFSGLNFYPYAICESAYYIDSFSKDRFINLDSYHEVIQKEKIEELGNIAHSLGAKECYLESYEEDISSSCSQASSQESARTLTVSGQASFDIQQASETSKKRSIVFSQIFEGSNQPNEPELHWFKKDMGINSLIKKRCSDANSLHEYSIQIDTTSSMAISVARAAKIDAALKTAKTSSDVSIENKARSESRRKLVYTLKF